MRVIQTYRLPTLAITEVTGHLSRRRPWPTAVFDKLQGQLQSRRFPPNPPQGNNAGSPVP